MARMLSGTKKGQVRKTARRAYKKTAPTRRRRRTAKKSFLSEIMSEATATAGAKAVLSGAVGGGGAILIEKFSANASQDKQALYTAIAGFLTASVLKMPSIGAGMGAVALYKYAEHSGMLADDMNWADGSGLPAVLNDDMSPMYLEAGPIGTEGMYLQDNAQDDYSVGYYGMGFGG